MDYPNDIQLESMARSLREQIGVANQLQLSFTAQLLAMAVMEITTRIHGISQHELHALCEHMEDGSSLDREQAVALDLGLRSFDRRARSRRGRI